MSPVFGSVRRTHWLGVIACLLSAGAALAVADEIELTSGAKYQGRVLDESDRLVVFQVVYSNGASAKLELPRAQVKNILIDGAEPVIESPATAPARVVQPASPPPVVQTPAALPAGDRRTRAEVDALIAQAGRSAPDWFQATKLDYPATLDLTGRQRFSDWQPQKAWGAYYWSVIDPNNGRWHQGIRLLHHALTVRKDDREMLQAAMAQLGRCYKNYEKDYARSAFWYRKALEQGWSPMVHGLAELAECYWQLGSKSMAVELLRQYQMDRQGYGESIKLWAEMGEVDKALTLAEELANSGEPDAGYLYAGNACRLAGQYEKAREYYQKSLATTSGGRRIQQNHARAKAALEAVTLYDALDLSKVPDGVYVAESTGYRGAVKVEVRVAGGKLTSVKVLSHKEDMFFFHLASPSLGETIVTRQNLKGVDATTGATVTGEAILNAVAKALSGAMKK